MNLRVDAFGPLRVALRAICLASLGSQSGVHLLHFGS